MSSDDTTSLVPLPDGPTADLNVLRAIAESQTAYFPSVSEPGDELKLPNTITRTEFQQWVNANVIRIEWKRPSEDATVGDLSVCAVLKVAHVLKDAHLDYWVDTVLCAFRQLFLDERTLRRFVDSFVSLPMHVQQEVYAAAAMDKHLSMEYLTTFLHVLPKYLHPLILPNYISPTQKLIIPTSSLEVMIAFLDAIRLLDTSSHHLDSLAQSTLDHIAFNSNTSSRREEGSSVQDWSTSPICLHRALNSALQHHSSLSSLSLNRLVYYVPSSVSPARWSQLPNTIATLTSLRSLSLGSQAAPLAAVYLVYLERTLQPLVDLRQLKLYVNVKPSLSTSGTPHEERWSREYKKRKAEENAGEQQYLVSLLMRGLAAAPTVSDLVVMPVDNPRLRQRSPTIPTSSTPSPCYLDYRDAKAQKFNKLCASDSRSMSTHWHGTPGHHGESRASATYTAPQFQWMSSCSLSGSLCNGVLHTLIHGIDPLPLTNLSIMWQTRHVLQKLEDPEAVFSRLKQCCNLTSFQILFVHRQGNGFGAALASALESLPYLETVLLALPVDYIQQCLPSLATTATCVADLSLTCIVGGIVNCEVQLCEVEWARMCGFISRLPLVQLVLSIKEAVREAMKLNDVPILPGQGSDGCCAYIPGLAALRGLTRLRYLGLKGWPTALRRPQDCEVLGEMQQLESMCLDVGLPHREHPDFVPVLSALPRLSNLRLDLLTQANLGNRLRPESSAETAAGFLSRFRGHRPPHAWPALRQLRVSTDSFEDARIVACCASTISTLSILKIGHGFESKLRIERDEYEFEPFAHRAQELAACAPKVAVHVYPPDAVQGLGCWTEWLWPACLWADSNIFL